MTRFLRGWAGVLLLAATGAAAQPATQPATYTNPLPLRLADGSLAESCADPSLLRDRTSSPTVWYLYCTMDPVSHKEREGKGWKFRMMPVYRSVDLVNWYFVRDSFERRPTGLAGPKSGLWAPEPVYQNGSYYLYFTVTDVADRHSPEKGCENDSGIAVATSASPAGPWKPAERLVVPPRRAGAGCNFHWTFDPDVVEDDEGDRFLYYGSYGGGIFVQRLSKDGLRVEGDPVRIGAANRYEGAEVVKAGKYWYMFASSTDCCRGPLTGYALFVGRASSPEGPFLDREGNDMAGARVGGTPVLAQNGNRWVGAGHNTVFQDAAGQWWTFYHAVDRNQGFFSVEDKLTRRPLLLDRIDWLDGWPVINGGAGPSDSPQPRPVLVAGRAPAASSAPPASPTAPAATPLWTERFQGERLDARWSWIRPQAAGSWSAGHPGLRMATRESDLHVDTNNAAVLTTPLPEGDLRIVARIRLDAPLDCCERPVQAGLVVMRDDDNYVKLVELAHDGLRQVEFGKELAPVERGYPRYGNTVAGTPGEWTWLRIDIRREGKEERYTAWSMGDGGNWVGGGTWTHRLGSKALLGLVAMGGAGHAVTFGEVRVERLPP